MSNATLATIRTAPTRHLQQVANHRMDRLHTESETNFLIACLIELGRRSRAGRGEVHSG